MSKKRRCLLVLELKIAFPHSSARAFKPENMIVCHLVTTIWDKFQLMLLGADLLGGSHYRLHSEHFMPLSRHFVECNNTSNHFYHRSRCSAFRVFHFAPQKTACFDSSQGLKGSNSFCSVAYKSMEIESYLSEMKSRRDQSHQQRCYLFLNAWKMWFCCDRARSPIRHQLSDDARR